MKLLYIADATSIHTQRWLKYFAERGYAIYLITIGRKKQILPYAHHVINLKQFYYNSPTFLTNLIKTRKLLSSLKPDIVHAHFVHQYGWLGALSSFHPFVLTAWGTDILNLPRASRSGIGRKLTQYALQQADLITGISDYLRKEMIELGADEKKIQVIHWGVDLDQFRPDVDTATLRESLDLNNQPVVLSNRLHLPLYNNDIIIEAMALVLKWVPDAVLILQNAGGKPDASLIRLVKEKGITESVRFLPKFSHEALPAVYAAADIYVSVPSWDAGPISLVEAMACGAVPIISEVPGPMEWVADGVNGRVVPIRDIHALANAVYDLLTIPEKLKGFKQYNHDLVAKQADHKVLMHRMEKLYLNLVKE